MTSRGGLRPVPINPHRDAGMRAVHHDITDDEWQIYLQVRDCTALPIRRILANIRAVEHVVRDGVPGDIVECGVWRGGSSAVMALALMEAGDTERSLWMYDTFETADAPDAWRFTAIEDVQANMRATGFDRVQYVRWSAKETIPAQMPERIAVLRLDSHDVKHKLTQFYPRLSKGGILIVDRWARSQHAVEGYFGAAAPFMSRIDPETRLAVKR